MAVTRVHDSGTVAPPPQPPSNGLARGAWVVAGVVTVLLLAVSGRFGYHGDELYFIGVGRHPQWGYADQPPLLPLLAAGLDAVSGHSLSVLRLPAILVTAAGILLTAQLTRELGGGRAAQTVGAAVYATSPFLLQSGVLLLTSTIDVCCWTAITWLLVRWVRTRDDRLLLWAAAVTAVAVQAKFLVVMLWVAVAVAVLLVGPRDLLRRRALWFGAAAVLLTAAPGLWWQADNGWPQVRMGRQIALETSAHLGGRIVVVVVVVVLAGLAGAALAGYGWWQLLRSEGLRQYRFFAVVAAVVLVEVLLINGRPYYVAGLFPMLWAAGASRMRWRRTGVTGAVLALSAALAVWTLPVYPVTWLRGTSLTVNVLIDEIGWQREVRQIAAVYRELPQQQRETTIVLADAHWLAGAVDRFGPGEGLPHAYSGHRAYWWLGPPPQAADTAIAVGFDEAYLRRYFTEVRRVTALDNGLDVHNYAQGKTVWLCTGVIGSWSDTWARWQEF
jgi:hypothetical protein